jgi:hypothetical protein
LDGEKHGLGWVKAVDGNTYYGEWRGSNRNGLGVYLRNDKSEHDGAVYVGQYKDDKKEGEGVYFYPDGRRYQGSCKGGEEHGVGVFTFAGKKVKGLWENGEEKQVLQSWD